MKLSKEEEQLIIKHRDAVEAGKAKKEGFLKKDLYAYDYKEEWKENSDFWLYTVEDVREAINELKRSLTVVLKKGTRFICYIDNGVEEWYDDENFGIEGEDATWSKKYLENIRKIK
jgi:hypothetical protein